MGVHTHRYIVDLSSGGLNQQLVSPSIMAPKSKSGFGTPSVAVATTPTVISTFFSHILAKRKRRSKERKSLASGGPGGGPEDQLAYEEGIKVVKKFLEYASTHGVEEVQAFTAMRVPNPRKS